MQEAPPLTQIHYSDKDAVRKFAEFLTVCYKKRAEKKTEKSEHVLPDHQDEETTARRIKDAEAWVIEEQEQMIASFVVVPPNKTGGAWWYRQEGVVQVNQVAVHPDYQGGRYLSIVLNAAEKRALELGAREIAGSVTSWQKRLLRVYVRKGYRVVDCKWSHGSRYGAVIFSKTIQDPSLRCSFLRRFRRKLKYFRRFIKYGLMKG